MYFKVLVGVQYELRAAEGTSANCEARVCRYREARGERVAAVWRYNHAAGTSAFLH